MAIPSLVKKYLMALTGAIMVGFVFIHMLGNLQMFGGPDAMNGYAHFLHTLPKGFFWGFRIVLLLSLVVHVWMAILIGKENRAARPVRNAREKVVQASWGSRTMGLTGSIVLFFIVFHLLQFTTRSLNPEFSTQTFYTTLADGTSVYDVYKMLYVSFTSYWYSGIYIFCMALLCLHLSHAVSSMFQSMGLRNRIWRPRLDLFSLVYGWIIFLGFIAIPLSVQFSLFQKKIAADSTIIISDVDAQSKNYSTGDFK
jgi:succinate dehydrogenase / fumarate reductase, cytochrome b subunit